MKNSCRHPNFAISNFIFMKNEGYEDMYLYQSDDDTLLLLVSHSYVNRRSMEVFRDVWIEVNHRE